MPFYDIFSMIHGDYRFHKKNVFVLAHYKIYREQYSIIRGVTKIEFVLVKRKGLFFCAENCKHASERETTWK